MQRVLVLGAGKHQRIEGAEHHDRFRFDGINLPFDLNNAIWPIERDVYDLIICHHVVEHLESLTLFMNRVHRILKVNGILEIETPNAGVNPDLEFCDPTHIRCYRKATFQNYFTPSGIEKFGYTDKAWHIKELYTKRLEITDDTIVVKLTPIKLTPIK